MASVTTQVMPASSRDVPARRKISLLAMAMASRTRSGRRAERPRQPLEDDVVRDGRGELAGRLATDAVDHAVDAAFGVDEGHVLVVGPARVPDRCGTPPEAPASPRCVSLTIEDPREVDEPCDEPTTSATRNSAVEPVEPVIGAGVASKSMTTASARPIRAFAGRGCSGPGCATPSALLTAGGIGYAVHRRAPQADVLDEELAVAVDAKPEVLARDLGAAGDLHVHPRRAAAAADRERVLAHEEHVRALLVLIGQPRALAVVPGVV